MKDQNLSFTLIELLVTMTFILLFSGMSIAYYSQYTENKKLENASRRLSSTLSLVRQHMVSGDSSMCEPAPLTTPPARISYYAFVVNDNKSYTIQPYCSIGTSKPVTFRNESNIYFITPVPPAPYPVVTFYPVTGASRCTYLYLQSSVLSGAQQCRYVKINQTGSITENTCTDCTSCPTTCP